MAKDYNSYTFKNKAVDNIQSRTNTATDPDDKKKSKKKDRRKRKAEIKKQATSTKSGLKARGTYDVDVSGERKVKNKVAKIQKKIDKVSTKKDARQKKQVDSGVRKETRKNKLLQKQVMAKRVIKAKPKDSGKNTRTKKTKNPKEDGGTISSKSNFESKQKTKNKKNPKIKEKTPKPIRRGIQIADGGQRRKYNNQAAKGSFLGIRKKIR